MVIQRKALPGHNLLQSAVYAAVGLAASRGAAQVVTTFDYTGSAQTYVVPATGDYDIADVGGQGGFASDDGTPGGQGAEAAGFFNLTARTVLTIDVGGLGGNGQYTGGGGGGSFVYNTTTSTLLLVGGGGGGGYHGGGVGGNGQTTPSGDGSGGGAKRLGSGGGGGGFKGDGYGGSPLTGSGGGGFPSVSGGGGFSTFGGTGAFGGGGGGGFVGAGGGGGYTGGAGGYGGSGGGGTSYDVGSLPTLVAGFQSGNGQVVITSVVPEPGSMALVGFAALAAGAGFGLRRRAC
jgi:hypothetical protein